MSIDQYNAVPGSNDLANYFKTGMRPSAVKTAGWDIMADLASYIVALPTAGGTSNVLTVTNGRPFGALVAGLLQVLNPASANTGPATLAPDGLAAAPIFTNGAALAGGEMQAGVPILLKYDGTNWNLLNPAPPGRNLFVDPCCRVASRGNSGAKGLNSNYKYGNVDLVQMKATGTLVSAGSLTQDTTGTITSAATPYAIKAAGVTITGSGKVFVRRWIESADAISLKNQIVLFSVLVRHDVGSSINGFLTVNKGGAVNDFSSPVTIATGVTVSVATGTDTFVTAAVSMGDCSNGIEVILELDCGAVTAKNFYATDWQACPKTLAQKVSLPTFEDDVNRAMRYYEQSYTYGIQEGTATAAGRIRTTAFAAVGNGQGLGNSILYAVPKVAAPNFSLTIYSTSTGSTSNVFDLNGSADVAVTAGSSSIRGYDLLNSSGSSLTANHALTWQFVADARL